MADAVTALSGARRLSRWFNHAARPPPRSKYFDEFSGVVTAAASKFLLPSGLFASKFLRKGAPDIIERRSGKRLRSRWKTKNFRKPW
jgi:hypothetical protein